MADGVTVDLATGCQLRAGVETKPSKPKNEHTQGSQRQAVTRNSVALAVLAIFAQTGTKEDSTDQSQHTTDGVHHRGTGKVVESMTKGVHHETAICRVAEPAAAPGPVSFYWIDDQ